MRVLHCRHGGVWPPLRDEFDLWPDWSGAVHLWRRRPHRGNASINPIINCSRVAENKPGSGGDLGDHHISL